MPEEASGASEVEEAQNSPEPGAATATPEPPDEPKGSESEVDWQKRYLDTQSEYTRANQEAKELRQQQEQVRYALQVARDPDHPQYREALEALGFDVEESEELDEDETETLRRQVEELRETYQSDQEQREIMQLEAAEDDWLAQNIGALQDKEGHEFTDNELALLVNYATQNRLTDGQPDLDGAFKALSGAWDERQKAYRESKRAPQAPNGATAATDIDMDDAAQRREFMHRKLQELAD